MNQPIKITITQEDIDDAINANRECIFNFFGWKIYAQKEILCGFGSKISPVTVALARHFNKHISYYESLSPDHLSVYVREPISVRECFHRILLSKPSSDSIKDFMNNKPIKPFTFIGLVYE